MELHQTTPPNKKKFKCTISKKNCCQPVQVRKVLLLWTYSWPLYWKAAESEWLAPLSLSHKQGIRYAALPWQCQATQVWKPLKPSQNLNTQCCHTHSIGPQCTFRFSVVWCLGRQHERTRRSRWGTAECHKPTNQQLHKNETVTKQECMLLIKGGRQLFTDIQTILIKTLPTVIL